MLHPRPQAYARAMDSMARLNRTTARLMHKYNAHGATDVTGFGLLGHAQNLARNQKNEVSFVIHNLPVIAKMGAVAKACGNMFQLLQGNSAETSGTCERGRGRGKGGNDADSMGFEVCLLLPARCR